MFNPLQLLQGANGAILGVIVAVSSLIAVFGYFIAKLGLDTKYLLLIAGGLLLLAFIFAAIFFIWKFIQKKKGDSMENELAREAAAKKQQRAEAKVAVQDIRDRWTEAMQTLKATKVKIYDLPWLLLIGEPQSGKTTTLRNSGLDFPVGKDALSGSGGTVNCDWWFTNESVILDTAGRFTMPVDSAPDRQEWHAFLKMLRKYRSRCPINGVIITIPATSLLEDNPELIKVKAANIQEKLHELVKVLGVNFPVYIMISKLDLVYGFAEFCASLSSNERTQALGWNRTDIQRPGFNTDEFNSFFSALASRLHFWSLRRLRDLPAGNEADRVYAFPLEFKRLKYSLSSYLETIFRQDRFHVPLLLRGCYFSSGLQEGRSIAKALLGDKEDDAPQGMIAEFAKSFVQSRAYFINVFYKKVFRERFLVGKADKSSRQELFLRITAAVISVIFFCGGSWILYNGYWEMKENVRPLEAQVKQARSILLSGENAISAEKINDVIRVIDTLEKGRRRLASTGTKRFLKGKGNSIQKDLGRIEDALIEQKLMSMLMYLSGQKISDTAELTSPEEKAAYQSAMIQYLGYFTGRTISSSGMKDAFDIIPWEEPYLADVSRKDIDRIIQGYPYGDQPGVMKRTIPDSQIQLRRGLATLHSYWDSYYERQWKEQQQLFKDINTRYEELLTTNIRKGEDQVSEIFSSRLQQFVDAVDALLAKGQEQSVWHASLKDECITDYQELEQSLLTREPSGLALLSSTAQRHAGICEQLSANIGEQWQTDLSSNQHILTQDGTIHPDLLVIYKALNNILQYGPLFDSDHAQKLQSNPGDFTSLLDFWHTNWVNESSDKVKEFSTVITPVTAEKWDADILTDLVSRYFNYLIWQADRQAVMTAMPIVLGGNDAVLAGKLQPGTSPPKLAQAAWLASRYELLRNLSDWLTNQHPGSYGIQPVHNLMTDLIASSWRDCLSYWVTTLKSVRLGSDILKSRNWQTFRTAVIDTHGLILDPTVWPLDSFLENMALEKINLAKTAMKGTGDKSIRTSNLHALEKRLEKTAYVLNAAHLLPQLERAQADYLTCIEEMSDDATWAFSALKAGKSGTTNVNISAFKALSSFRKRVEHNADSRGELLSQRLADIESHGFNLLRREVAEEFDYEWRSFQDTWRIRFKNRFPFGESEDWIKEEKTFAGRKTIHFNMASAYDLHDFFFNKQSGFEVFIARHGLISSRLNDDLDASFFLSEDQKTFLQTLFDWRNFLFTETGRPKAHVAEVILDTDIKAEKYTGASRFTQMRFNGLEAQDGRMLQLRFSGRKYKQGAFQWALNAADEISIEAQNEETTDSSTLQLTGGSLALPVLLSADGEHNETSRFLEWELTLRMPQPVHNLRIQSDNDLTASISADKNYLQTGQEAIDRQIYVPIRVKWDQMLPSNIIWPVN